MGQFDTSLSKAKEVVKFENDRIDKIYSSIERDQWEIKVIALIESIGDEWNKFLGAPPVDETRLNLEYLTIQSLALTLRDREKLLKKAGAIAFWGEIDQQLQDFCKEKNLFPLGTSIAILQSAAQSIEDKLALTEWIIQTPRRWNLKWDSKENLDIKVDFLSREIKDYKSRLDSTLDKLITDSAPLGQEPFPWPRELNAILLLLKLSAIRKLKSPCIELPDIRLTATLISDPKSCTPVLHQQIGTAEKSLEELRKKNASLQTSLQQARAMAESGNHLKALEALKQVPSNFRLNEQREILDLTNKITQRLTQIEAVRKKLDQMDLQRLDWKAISDFCDEIQETIHHEGDFGSDYEVEASRLLSEIKGYLLRHRNSIIIKWSTALGITTLLLLGIYYFYSSKQEANSYQVEILTANSNVTWSVYQDTGELVQKGKGKALITAPSRTLFLVIRQGNRIGFERALWNGNSFHSFVQNSIFSYPLVRIQALDSTGKNSLDPENYELRINRIPVPSDIEGIHVTKGIHRFTIRQQGQPEFDTTQMISQRNETISLVSPWVPIDFEANADDLFVSINNSSKRLLPYRFFLPVGNHEAIFSDSRGDIRESRRIHVEGGSGSNEELGVSAGTLKIKVIPPRAGLKLMVNGITHSLSQGQRDLSLSTGEQRIQLFINEELVYEANLALRLGEEIERTINLTPNR